MQGRTLRVVASFDSSLASQPVVLSIRAFRTRLIDVTEHFSFKKLTTNIRTTDCMAEWSIIPKETSSSFSPQDPLQICVEVYGEAVIHSILVHWGPFIVIEQSRSVAVDGNLLGMNLFW
jgi:hypothetical protein